MKITRRSRRTARQVYWKENVSKDRLKTKPGRSKMCFKSYRNISGKYQLKRSYAGLPIQCLLCDKSFNNRAVLKIHNRFHLETTPFYCKYCGARFKLSGSLKCHIGSCVSKNATEIVSKHPLCKGPDKRFECNICNKTFTLRASLKDHLLGHDGKSRMRFICQTCGLRFRRKVDLVGHTKSHGHSDMLECEECHSAFLSASDLREHQVVHSDVRPFTCTVCSASYKRKSHLRRHVASHAAASATEKPPPRVHRPRHGSARPVFECGQCGRACKSARLLAQHATKHTGVRPHACATCGKRFRQRGGMRRHVATVHDGQRHFMCEVCGRSFTAKATVTAHMLIHSGEKPHACTECGRRFRTPQQLACHRAMHSELRPHACTWCPKAFRRARNLQVHMRTHTGEKPYACAHCGRGFAQKNDMKKHTQIHLR